jgi:hypothetical protein
VLYARRIPIDATRSRFRPRLVWLDTTTGAIRGSHDLAGLEESDPRIGPLVIHRDRLWTFWGNGQHEASRDVIELLPLRP